MTKKKILIVDDDEDLLAILEKRLSDAGYRVFKTTDGKKSLSYAREIIPDLILLDIMMPGVDGLEVKTSLNKDVLTAGIPVIFLTVKTDTQDKIKGLRLGVDDYITKPFNLEELLARINSVLNRRKFYEQISMTDGLSGLYNRLFFEKQIAIFFTMAKRYKQLFSLAIVDIDGLKTINDTFGHAAGDFVIKAAASIIKETLRESDIITRYGGDEFVVILPGSDEASTRAAMDRIKEKIKGKKFTFEDIRKEISFSVSVGIASYNDRFSDARQLFELADINMYKDKRKK